jgi:hypothetical protein
MVLGVFLVTHNITQSINVIENPHFHELLLYFGQGHVTDDEIPGRTCLTENIIKAWKRERDEFYQEMKVRRSPCRHQFSAVDHNYRSC